VDIATFSAIYAREFRYVWTNVRRMGVPPRDLPDVTHDVLFAVFKNLWKYDTERPFRPWLFGVLMRVTSDHLRLARNHREVLDQLPDRRSLQPPRRDDGAARAVAHHRRRSSTARRSTPGHPHHARLRRAHREGHRPGLGTFARHGLLTSSIGARAPRERGDKSDVRSPGNLRFRTRRLDGSSGAAPNISGASCRYEDRDGYRHSDKQPPFARA
jgi:hypothetical protein